MSAVAPASRATGAPEATDWLAGLSWRRVALACGLAALATLLISPGFITPFFELLLRSQLIALTLTLAYTLAGNWPQRKMPRWHVQILAVVLLAPVCAAVDGLYDTRGSLPALLRSDHLMRGFMWISFTSLTVGLLATLVALVREREAQFNAQALRFALERETLERQALDAQLRVMTAQIEPHFLLNTLANVQALVETGSPRAAPVLRSLIAYFRAALPRLRDAGSTLADELALARAYLEVMQMRIPDRLQFQVAVPPELQGFAFPSMALLTLVENAVRHGIDPAEQGGRIDIGARREDGGEGLVLWVQDSGVGLDPKAAPGTGLSHLRQRLQAFYGPEARLELTESLAEGDAPGLRAELHLPVPRPTPASTTASAPASRTTSTTTPGPR